MERWDQERNVLGLLRQGRSDEAVERLTGVSLLRILELRARLASAPFPALVRARR